MMVQQIQKRIRSRGSVVQETTLIMWLELWQIKQMQTDEWICETCAWLRSQSGMTLKDIQVQIIPQESPYGKEK
jgi:hypothetical protein